MSSKTALICSYYIPQTDLDSYSRRLFHLLEFLREAGWREHFDALHVGKRAALVGGKSIGARELDQEQIILNQVWKAAFGKLPVAICRTKARST